MWSSWARQGRAAAAGKAFFVPDLSNRRRQGGSSCGTQWGLNLFEVAINLYLYTHTFLRNIAPAISKIKKKSINIKILILSSRGIQ
jgi:hypothetical protein